MNKHYLYLSALCLLTACGPEATAPLFTALGEQETGIRFNNRNAENEQINILTYEYLYNGAGVAIGDVNNDGLTDIYLVANNLECKLYLNKGGLRFEDISAKSGTAAKKGWKTGACMADVNGDGFLDIYVCRSADGNPDNRRNLLFVNNGDLTFTEKAAEYGVDDDSYSSQAVFFDMDKDGDLDLFTLNHSLISISNKVGINPLLRNARELYLSNRLFRNDQGKFTDISDEAGIAGGISNYGLGVVATDLNQDGWTDLYVTNDYAEHDHLYLNDPKKPGYFTDAIKTATGHVPHFSMGADVADINRDGLPDIFAGDMLPEDNKRQKLLYGPHEWDKFQIMLRNELHYQYMRNMLQLNNGDGTFSEVGQLAGVSNTDWSWATLFADYDNDGWNDLFITNGYKRDFTNNDFLRYREDVEARYSMGQKPQGGLLEVVQKMPSNKVHNYMFRNTGQLRFEDVSTAWGFSRPVLSQGAAYADLDNDGDLDLVVNNMDEPVGILRNNAEQLLPNHRSIRFSLVGNAPNTKGIGTKVRLFKGQYVDERELQPVRGFQSGVDFVLHFGLGAGPAPDSALVLWPSGKCQRLRELAAGQTINLNEKDAKEIWAPLPAPKALFAAMPAPLSFVHQEDAFEDFNQQSTLPCFQSRQGPHAAQGDVNGDGLADLFFPGAAGQPGELWLQTTKGAFNLMPNPAFEADKNQEGVSSLLADMDGDGDADLVVANGGYAFDENDALYGPRLYLNDGKGHFSAQLEAFPNLFINAGALAGADVDKDGDWDLFVGAQGKPKNYPLAAPSLLLLNDGKGHFSNASANWLPDNGILGMVADALWQDLNADGWPDLVAVGPHMPLRCWINQAGKRVALEEGRMPTASSGWWQSVAAADWDKDGDLDLLVGNWGMNNQIKASLERPALLVGKDFDQNGTLDPLLGYTIQGKLHPGLSLDELVFQLPSMRKRFPNYESYSNVDFETLLPADMRKGAVSLPLERFETSLLLNDGQGRFQWGQLPTEAQFSPIYAMLPADFNGDGHLDVLLAGNQSTARVSMGKMDANYGLLLLGDGKNNFNPMPQHRSGLSIRGDVKQLLLVAGAKPRLMAVRNNDTPVFYTWGGL